MMRRYRENPVKQILENHMRKGALLLALVFAVSATTAASAAKKMAKPTPDPAIAAQQNSAAFFQDALHPWAPTASMSGQSKAKGKKKKKS